MLTLGKSEAVFLLFLHDSSFKVFKVTPMQFEPMDLDFWDSYVCSLSLSVEVYVTIFFHSQVSQHLIYSHFLCAVHFFFHLCVSCFLVRLSETLPSEENINERRFRQGIRIIESEKRHIKTSHSRAFCTRKVAMAMKKETSMAWLPLIWRGDNKQLCLWIPGNYNIIIIVIILVLIVYKLNKIFFVPCWMMVTPNQIKELFPM